MRRRAGGTSFLSLIVAFLLVLAPTVAGAQARTPAGEVQVTPPPDGLPVQGAPQPPLSPPPPPPEGAATSPPEEEKPNPPAGYIPGSGFIIQSPDQAYKLRIGMVAAYRFEPVYSGGDFTDRNTFFVLRPFIGGNFFRKWIHFWTSFEFASNPPYLLDSYVELTPIKEFGLRIGQQWTPFDRHEYFGPQEILFPDWAPVSEYFWTGRDKGVTALGTLFNKVDYYAGVYSGTPLRQYNALPGNYVFQGRVTVNPMGPVGTTEFPYIVSEGPVPWRVSFTLQGSYGKVQQAAENFNPSTFRFDTMPTGDTRKQAIGGADFWLQGPWIYFFADAFIRRTEPTLGAVKYTSIGAWGQVGVPLIPRTLDVATRFNWLNASTDLSNDDFYSIEGMFAYYVSHSLGLVVKLRYAAGHQNTPGMAALGPVPLILSTPGWTQLGTLQLNLAF